MVESDSSPPLMELIIGIPLYSLMAAFNASTFELSNCNGRSQTSCIFFTALHNNDFSSHPGTPTLTSRKSAPASRCERASFCRYSKSPSARAALSFFLPVGLRRSPQMIPCFNSSSIVEEQMYVPSGLDGAGAGRPLYLDMARMVEGDVPQHPPIMEAPASIIFPAQCANS